MIATRAGSSAANDESPKALESGAADVLVTRSPLSLQLKERPVLLKDADETNRFVGTDTDLRTLAFAIIKLKIAVEGFDEDVIDRPPLEYRPAAFGILANCSQGPQTNGTRRNRPD
jgi:hypothetical protein